MQLPNILRIYLKNITFDNLGQKLLSCMNLMENAKVVDKFFVILALLVVTLEQNVNFFCVLSFLSVMSLPLNILWIFLESEKEKSKLMILWKRGKLKSRKHHHNHYHRFLYFYPSSNRIFDCCCCYVDILSGKLAVICNVYSA